MAQKVQVTRTDGSDLCCIHVSLLTHTSGLERATLDGGGNLSPGSQMAQHNRLLLAGTGQKLHHRLGGGPKG